MFFSISVRSADRLQQPCGADGEFLIFGDSTQAPRKSHFGVGARRKAQPIVQLDQPESGLQQVIAVGAPADDVQEQIQLRRGRIAAIPRIQFVH
jgi:hypothetical protein